MAADHLSTDKVRDDATPVLDPTKAESLQQFIEQVGGIENARQALKALAELKMKRQAA